MSSIFDAIVSVITGQLGSVTPGTRGDRVVLAVTLVLSLAALAFVVAVARGLG